MKKKLKAKNVCIKLKAYTHVTLPFTASHDCIMPLLCVMSSIVCRQIIRRLINLWLNKTICLKASSSLVPGDKDQICLKFYCPWPQRWSLGWPSREGDVRIGSMVMMTEIILNCQHSKCHTKGTLLFSK